MKSIVLLSINRCILSLIYFWQFVVGYDSHKVDENVPHLERNVSHTLLQSGIVVSVVGSH